MHYDFFLIQSIWTYFKNVLICRLVKMSKESTEKNSKFVCIECLNPADEIYVPFVNNKDIRLVDINI